MPRPQFSTGVFGTLWLNAMPTVEKMQHLYHFFPQLENRSIIVTAGSVAEVLSAINEIAPGFTDYVLDEQGALRRHVNLSINQPVNR